MGLNNREHERFGGGLAADGLPPLIAAAHELKSPLALIRQLSMTLQTGDIGMVESARILHQISLTSERALRLTSDLTRSAKLSDALFEMEPINPEKLCEDIVYELEPLFKAYGRSVNLMPRRHPLLLIANRDLLRRIIMNFSDNALHYAGEDRAVQIQIKALNKGKTIRMGVRDFGPAIATDLWRSLRNKLTADLEPVYARPQSSGLGLYVASQFADAMNGRIGVIRHRDGATFYVDLHASNQLSLL